MQSIKKIRVAIVGVGNCASSLVQGVDYYKKQNNNTSDEQISGVMHNEIGSYKISDIVFSAAFDVDNRKVGQDLSTAIFAAPNCALKISDMSEYGVSVLRGKTLDGIDGKLGDAILLSTAKHVDVAKVLQDTKTDVVINYLPTGSDKAATYYANEAIKAGCGFINCMPARIATNPIFQKKFSEKGVPVIGDDVKSQIGATIVHRTLLKLMKDRGVKVLNTSQINIGGNTDFLNFIDRSETKEFTKGKSLNSVLGENNDTMIHTGLHYDNTRGDQKWAHIYIEGEGFGCAITKMQVKLEVEDSPNSAGVIIDAVRYIKLAMDRKIGGPLNSPSAYLMKNPPVHVDDAQAKSDIEKFINQTL